jgi:hypothetical protein
MATGLEMRFVQKDKLYALLNIKLAYENAGLPILDELQRELQRTKVVMEAEDVAFVEKAVGLGYGL